RPHAERGVIASTLRAAAQERIKPAAVARKSAGYREPVRMAAPEVRVVAVRPRTVLLVLGIAVAVGLALVLVLLAWHVLTWILIAALLAAALNPAVEAFERRGLGRPYAASLVF